MFKLEYLNDHGHWIRKSWHKSYLRAVKAADRCRKDGYETRIKIFQKRPKEG